MSDDIPFLERVRLAQEASYQDSLRRGQESYSMAMKEIHDSRSPTADTPSDISQSASNLASPISPVAATEESKPVEITADALKGLKVRRIKRQGNSDSYRVTKTSRRPTKKQKSRLDARGYPFYDLSFYNGTFSQGKVDRTTRTHFLVFERLSESYLKSREPKTLDSLRDALHEVEFFPDISHKLIKETRILEEGNGLRRIIDSDDGTWPPDITADALALWFRWKTGDIDPNPMRYLARSGSMYKLDQRYKRYHWDYNSIKAGNKNLQNGQWWPYQLALLRDGGHGSARGGIHGNEIDGAHSIIMSGGESFGYDDRDDGDVIKYTGTISDNPNEATRNTKMMRLSFITSRPVRVFRSHRANTPYSPETGIRYDGHYKVVSEKCLDGKTHHYQFELHRVEGQAPIRAMVTGEVGNRHVARPSKAEIQACANLQLSTTAAASE